MKLPVFKAFGATIGLVVSRFATLVTIAWLPVLAVSGVTTWLSWNLMPVLAKVLALNERSRPEDVAAAFGPLFLPILLAFAVALVFMPMLFGGLLRYIVRGERPSAPFYLHFGGDELRVLGTYILLVLIDLAIAIAVSVAGGLLLAALGGKGAQAAPLAERIIDLAGRIFTIFIALRLSLAFPAAIGFNTVGIGPSWQLTRGNVVRLLLYWVLWYGVLLAAALLIALPFLAPIGAFLKELEQVAGNDAAIRELLIAKTRALAEWAAGNASAVWLGFGAHFLISLVITIFQVTAAGVAYRLIRAEGADAA